MEITLGDRIKHAWDVFRNKDQGFVHMSSGPEYSYRPDRVQLARRNEQSLTNAIYNRIALDVASLTINHVRLDENGRYLETIDSGLNTCLTLEANIDQTARAFIQDAVLSMLDEGCIALLPVDTSFNPSVTNSYDILTMRVAKIIGWKPKHVRLLVYNDKIGDKVEITVPKSTVAIIENPLYSIMNKPISTMQRLVSKLNLMDIIDNKSGSEKLDLVVQLPYTVRSKLRRDEAEDRRQAIENQLSGSKYGIAYIDAAERITQLNRPVENNLLKQVEYLTNLLYGQLGITQTILDGTADEKTMLNYHNRTIEPIVSAITVEMKRKFLTKTARSQRQSIEFFRDPFRLVPIENIAEIADKFTRNEIMSKNEFRQVIGMKPSNDPKADQLINSNINHPPEEAVAQKSDKIEEKEVEIQNGE